MPLSGSQMILETFCTISFLIKLNCIIFRCSDTYNYIFDIWMRLFF